MIGVKEVMGYEKEDFGTLCVVANRFLLAVCKYPASGFSQSNDRMPLRRLPA